MEQEPRVRRREPRPADAIVWEPSARWVRGLLGDTTVVDSRAPVLVWEPGAAVPHYAFPDADVRTDLLRASDGGSYDLHVDGAVVPDAPGGCPASSAATSRSPGGSGSGAGSTAGTRRTS
jgi:uncharacterized protein (DUF427 family)